MQRILLFMLISLLTLQSVDAVADAIKFHQPNTSYTETDYYPLNTVADTNTVTNDNSKNINNKINDHCCYCHGISSALFIDTSLGFFAINTSDQLINYHVIYNSYLITPDLRPPIV